MTVDKSGERVKKMFGEIAGRYDLMNHLLSGGVDLYWRRRTVRKAPLQGEDPMLDLCTGTGDLALAYYKSNQGRSPVVGADFCHPMLALATEKAAKAFPGGQISFVEADAQNLPFPDDHFQLVSVSFGLRNVSDTDQGLREMTRVCKPGGKVVVLEFSIPRWQPFRGFYLWYFRNVLPTLGQWLARNRQDAYNYLPASVLEFPEGQALADRMTAAGLSRVTYHALTLGVATLYIGVK